MSLRSQLIPKHDVAVAAAKKVDIELKEVSLAAATEYNKKGKCPELERFEREKAMHIFDITTEEPTGGVLMQLDASLALSQTCRRTCPP
jgi:hypothetical protein